MAKYYVFRINYGDWYKLIRSELINNQLLRQGWGTYDMAINAGYESFKAGWQTHWEKDLSDKEMRRRYKNLSIMMDIEPGDYIIIPNHNPLVMNTFDEAVAFEPDAHPLFHSDRGFQYTSKQFSVRLKKHHMKQSMSRVAHCIDNGPMEGFWGILKRETYYGRRFTSKTDLINAIESYIYYYNTERIQRKLHLMTPVEYHENYYAAA